MDDYKSQPETTIAKAFQQNIWQELIIFCSTIRALAQDLLQAEVDCHVEDLFDLVDAVDLVALTDLLSSWSIRIREELKDDCDFQKIY